MNKTILVALFCIVLSGCGFLFLGPKVSRYQFKIVKMKEFSDQPPDHPLIEYNNFYYWSGDSVTRDPNKKAIVTYLLIKFYKNGKLGFFGGGSRDPLSDTAIYNSILKPKGYQWGYYFVKNDSVYMEIRTQRNDTYHFWVGKLGKDIVYVSHEIDKKNNIIALGAPMIFKYKN
jgi:hypothetical protein